MYALCNVWHSAWYLLRSSQLILINCLTSVTSFADMMWPAANCPESGRCSRRPSWSWRRRARRQTRTHLIVRIVRRTCPLSGVNRFPFLHSITSNHPVGLVELFAINLTLSYPCMTHSITTSGTLLQPYSLPSFDNWLVPSSAKVGSACSVLPACCLIEQLLSPKRQSCNMMVYMLHGWQTLQKGWKKSKQHNTYLFRKKMCCFEMAIDMASWLHHVHLVGMDSILPPRFDQEPRLCATKDFDSRFFTSQT